MPSYPTKLLLSSQPVAEFAAPSAALCGCVRRRASEVSPGEAASRCPGGKGSLDRCRDDDGDGVTDGPLTTIDVMMDLNRNSKPEDNGAGMEEEGLFV